MKILVIQTAFIGDVVLATGLLEKLHRQYPDATIDIVVRKGNESLFTRHPFLHHVWVWNKQGSKYRHLFLLLKEVRKQRYDVVINVQRFAATGLLAAFSRGRQTIGFDKNPFSFLFSDVVHHTVSEGSTAVHEIDRNQQLIASFTQGKAECPRLYPSPGDIEKVAPFKKAAYICIAPASVWFTKQFPAEQWVSFIKRLPRNLIIYLLGAPGDSSLCDGIRRDAAHPGVADLSGRLNFLQSAALMQDAAMNYVNDSAPMHFASAVNAPVTAVYCSTIPAFGFGPLSDNSHIVQIAEPLPCRPCGLHGRARCPLGHFRCAKGIETEQLLQPMPEGR